MRTLGTDDRLMLGKVISMRMGNEGRRLSAIRVEPQVQVW